MDPALRVVLTQCCEQSSRLIVTGRGGRCNPCMPLTVMPRLTQGPLKRREDCSPAYNS